VAINIETGKMAWYYQTSPHDTHDWDSAQTPVLVDAEFNGQMRKLVLQASRNGYYFTLDRLTGEHLVTSKFSETVNWAKGINAKGQPVRDPAKDFHVAGALVSSAHSVQTQDSSTCRYRKATPCITSQKLIREGQWGSEAKRN
jgi:alcohol dehydrogenase (cytochrome c)